MLLSWEKWLGKAACCNLDNFFYIFHSFSSSVVVPEARQLVAAFIMQQLCQCLTKVGMSSQIARVKLFRPR